MINYGKVIEFNGEYGFIKSSDGIIDFEKEDLSNPVKEGDIVEFREEKGDYLIIARNVKAIDE